MSRSDTHRHTWRALPSSVLLKCNVNLAVLSMTSFHGHGDMDMGMFSYTGSRDYGSFIQLIIETFNDFRHISKSEGGGRV